MRVLVTGHHGYIGSVLTPLLKKAGHDVVGLDTDFFASCLLGSEVDEVPSVEVDIRDVTPAHCEGFDAVLHLAALSNDPLGNLSPQITYDINQHASVRLAAAAKAAGVRRFLFSSSCSLYGAGGEAPVTEDAAFYPVTPYGESKVLAEQEISKLADADFVPTYLRNATAYGVSPRLRGDIVVNNLVAHAVTTGKVLLQSDGTPWRPLVHCEDIARAFVALLDADEDLIRDRAYNVGLTSENYRIREVAELVGAAVEGSVVSFAEGASSDKRDYRVDCERIKREIPGFQPQWTVPTGIAQLVAAYREHGLTAEEFAGVKYQRIARIRELLDSGLLGPDLRPAS
ncbi:SDR family oxidoreductase [Longispora sp. K20-0274]|uniref:NAD-dependent epimerase/dehydratase family protein n=1 Tax=Longispora sp. K20-0274 TaxID=3088255 RepID=UPI003999ED56